MRKDKARINDASVRLVGPQTRSSLVLVVKNPRVLDLKGPQQLLGHGLALDPDSIPNPIMGLLPGSQLLPFSK